MHFVQDLLTALARLGAFPYFVGFDANGAFIYPETGGETAEVIDLTAYRLKKFPMAHRLK